MSLMNASLPVPGGLSDRAAGQSFGVVLEGRAGLDAVAGSGSCARREGPASCIHRPRFEAAARYDATAAVKAAAQITDQAAIRDLNLRSRFITAKAT